MVRPVVSYWIYNEDDWYLCTYELICEITGRKLNTVKIASFRDKWLIDGTKPKPTWIPEIQAGYIKQKAVDPSICKIQNPSHKLSKVEMLENELLQLKDLLKKHNIFQK